MSQVEPRFGMRVTPPSKLRRGLLLGVLGIAVVSPLGAVPVTRSCAPLFAMLCVFSITALILAPGAWRSFRGIEREHEIWAEDSSKLKRWKSLQSALYVMGMLFFVVSLLLHRPWHEGIVHWPEIIAAPGYGCLFWAPMVRAYIERHSAPKPGPRPEIVMPLESSAPIRSEHWGGRGVA